MADTDAIVWKLNDPVWAKMKGFSPWPGRVAQPTAEVLKIKRTGPSQCIYFFGTNNYAWIEEAHIKPYREHKEALSKSGKSAIFKDAIKQCESFILDPSVFAGENDSDFDKLRDSDDINEEASVRSSPIPVKAPLTEPRKAPKKASSRASLPAPVAIKIKSKEKKTPKPILTKKRAVTEVMEPEDVEEEDDIEDETPVTIAPKRIRKSSASKSAPVARRPNNKSYSSADRFNNTLDNGINDYSSTPVSAARKSAASQLLNRPATVSKPELEEIDMTSVSETLKKKNIDPSQLKFGFLGLGIMGSGIVKNLINSGHQVTIWNRTVTKCRKFIEAGATQATTPSDVVDAADITFSCVSDPVAVKEMVFGNCGVLSARTLQEGKGYIEMTSIDCETSKDIYEGLTMRGGRYLEAQIQGSKSQAFEGTLIILAAGDRGLFEECQTCFEAMGRNSFFLGEVGNASKMNLVLQTMAGVTLAALAESMALADRAGLQQKDVLEVLELTEMSSKMIVEKGNAIIKGEYPTNLPLMHLQKDLKLSLNMADQLEQPLPLTATSNEVYKHAKRLGYGEHDASSVYVRARF